MTAFPFPSGWALCCVGVHAGVAGAAIVWHAPRPQRCTACGSDATLQHLKWVLSRSISFLICSVSVAFLHGYWKKVSLNLKIDRNVQNISIFTTVKPRYSGSWYSAFPRFSGQKLLTKTCFEIMDSFDRWMNPLY